jgi:hypothetical protein
MPNNTNDKYSHIGDIDEDRDYSEAVVKDPVRDFMRMFLSIGDIDKQASLLKTIHLELNSSLRDELEANRKRMAVIEIESEKLHKLVEYLNVQEEQIVSINEGRQHKQGY